MNQSDHIVECARRLADKRMGGPVTPPARSKRSHPKRHATGFRKSLIDQKKSKKAKATQEANATGARKARDIIRRYYRGELVDLSGLSG